MPTWLNDAQPLSSTENGPYTFSTDPSTTFMQAPTAASFEFNQLQNPQLQQRLQNGASRNGSPAFNNPVYQTQQVIPSKRPRIREDSLGSASPRQNPSILPASRSQTPQQIPYQGFQGGVNGTPQFQTPTPYQHLQHAGTSASISPVIQNQSFPGQGGPQIQTASPSPFSPAGQNFASPAHSEHGSRVNTPQNGGQPYTQSMAQTMPQSMPFGGGSNPAFSSPQGSINSGAPSIPYNSAAQDLERRRMYEMRMRQVHANQAAMQPRNHGLGTPNPPLNPSHQMPGASYHVNLPRTPQSQQMGKPNSPEQFIHRIAHWMQQRELNFNPNPLVLGRSIPLMQLYSSVMRLGGSKRIEDMSQWTEIAKQFPIPQAQWLSAAQDISNYWLNNHLSKYETWFRQKTIQESQIRSAQAVQTGEMVARGQISPPRQAEPHLIDPQRQQFIHAQPQIPSEYQTPIKRPTSQPRSSFQGKQNGHMTTQQEIPQTGQSIVYPQSANLTPNPRTMAPDTRSAPTIKDEFETSAMIHPSRYLMDVHKPQKAPEGTIGEVFIPKIEHLGNIDGMPSHGGIRAIELKVVVDGLLEARPDMPVFEEHGVIDIQNLVMSLRSGIHAEVRLALDTLAALSLQPSEQMVLGDCDDLVETVMECAEDQVELLAENAAEVSDAMLISSYEEIVRGCRAEIESIQEVHEFGTLEYNLDRSVDRLICITTILRNFSFAQDNHKLLADPVVIRFMATVIRYLGTRNMLLRTYQNTLDLTKDLVIFLSNVAQAVEIPGKEEALSILHFLLSFAPSPPPTSNGDDDVSFASYNPATHRYLPPALESLAKLLARDDPNRSFYRDIFAGEATAIPPYDLLTRTFALAIASMPEFVRSNVLTLVDARKAYLAQGLLAAEILAGLIPPSEHSLARSWLSSQDGFALNLVKTVSLLETRIPKSQSRIAEHDYFGSIMIIERGLALLRKLAEKAKDTEGPTSELPPGALPRQEGLVGWLMSRDMGLLVVRQLCNYWGSEN